MYEAHPGGGQADSLWLLDQPDKCLLDINRTGSIHLYGPDGFRTSATVLEDLLHAQDPLRVVEGLEVEAGLSNPTRSAPTTAKVLT